MSKYSGYKNELADFRKMDSEELFENPDLVFIFKELLQIDYYYKKLEESSNNELRERIDGYIRDCFIEIAKRKEEQCLLKKHTSFLDK